MTVSAIFSMSQNRVIGQNNKIPWHLPDDLQFFKNKTTGHPIVMGRKTFESLKKPLPNRTHVVVTRNPHYSAPSGVLVAHTLAEALRLAAQAPGGEQIFFVGGAELLPEALPHLDYFYLTQIQQNVEGDARLVPFEHFFEEVERRDVPTPIPHSYLTLKRRRSPS